MSSSNLDPNAEFLSQLDEISIDSPTPFESQPNGGGARAGSADASAADAQDDVDASDLEGPSSPPPQFNPRTTAANAKSLKQIATDLVQEYGLTDKVMPTVNKFIQANTPEERMLILFCSLMSAQERARVSQWTILPDLKTNIDQYTRAMLLAPTLPGYRGTIDTEVLNAMRALNIHGLPNVKDIAESMEVLGYIGTCLTNFRASIKKHIGDSVEEGSSFRNIARICGALVKNTSIPITLQLYCRIAYLRWFYVKNPALQTSASWWIKVDENLQYWRDGMDRFFMKQYNADIAIYGDPAESGITTIAPNAVPEWFATVNKYAKKVVPMPSKGSKKRKRNP